ncbi:MAG TPA: GGDEF domain-containing protein [Solirubrobacteraceae bacterium]|jgi:diguanylate cyclase (GGDEF)-like protein|nr:GGDEF domain-containing protein [Solirubrobacteraceae bacterium]
MQHPSQIDPPSLRGFLRRALRPPEPGGTWLCRDEQARARLVELDRFLQPAFTVVALGGLVSIGACVAAGLLWGLLPLLALAPMMLIIRPRVRRATRPEYLVAGAAVALIVTLAFATAHTGGLSSPLAFWLLVPAVALPTRFDGRVVVVALALLLLMLVVAGVSFAGDESVPAAARAVGFVAAFVSFTTFATVLAGAEFRYRTASALDQLTGLLNRGALQTRFEELRQQASLTNAPICLIACDVDDFKGINDTYGHQVGDNVLEDLAQTMRAHLRSFELVYRLGGDEFLVVLPGADAERGLRVAERLRAAVDATRPAGVRVTASFGVSAGSGADATLGELYRRADEALYAAKGAGGDSASKSASPEPDRRLVTHV